MQQNIVENRKDRKQREERSTESIIIVIGGP